MKFGSRFAGMGDPRPGAAPLPLRGQPAEHHGGEPAPRLPVHRDPQRAAGLHPRMPAVPAVPPVLRRLRLRLAAAGGRGHLRPAGGGGPHPHPLHRGVVVDRGARLVGHVRESIRYSAIQSARRGRRGRRSPVAPSRRLSAPPKFTGPAVTHPCVLCGNTDHVLVYPANGTGLRPEAEIACAADDRRPTTTSRQREGGRSGGGAVGGGDPRIYAEVVDPATSPRSVLR